MNITSKLFKRKIEYDQIDDKKNTELIFVLYDEFVAKHKTEQVALRHFEQYLIGIRKYK